MITVIAASYFKKYGKQPGIAAFIDGVTAAATGAITGAVIVLARRSLIDIPTVLIGLTTLAQTRTHRADKLEIFVQIY